MTLYPYQIDVVDNIFRAFETNKNVMVQMPTGTGKTHVFCEIIKRERDLFFTKGTEQRKKLGILLLVHRKELLSQAQQRLIHFKIPCGRIIGGEINNNEACFVQIAMVQTLIRRATNEWPKNVSLIIVDEAHHVNAKSYRTIIQFYEKQNAKLLGVTATPIRLNGEGFRSSFQILVKSLTIKEFIKNGDLASYKHLATSSPDLRNVRIDKKTQDYDESELTSIMIDERIMADLIESYEKYGNNKKSLVFAVNIKHANEIESRFNAKNIKAKSISSKTNLAEREEIIKEFKNGEFNILINVQIFTEGFDCPEISIVQLARPTKSLALYMQMVGRAIRKKPDGSSALILDNAKLWETHGLVSQDREWTLDGVIVSNRTKTIIDEKSGEVKEVETPMELIGLGMKEVDEQVTKIIKEKKTKHTSNIYDGDANLKVNFIKNSVKERIDTLKLKDYNEIVINKLRKEILSHSLSNFFIEFESEDFLIKSNINTRKKRSEWNLSNYKYSIIQNGYVLFSHDFLKTSLELNESLTNTTYLDNYFNQEVSIANIFEDTFKMFFSIYYKFYHPDTNNLFKYNYHKNGFTKIKSGVPFFLRIVSPVYEINFSDFDLNMIYKRTFNAKVAINNQSEFFKHISENEQKLFQFKQKVKEVLQFFN
ncbi:DEAD/DEAH box helicase [Parasediminibacterium paludis]|uniref:DEAD/DEAH box helicase n=1 Tax=Parasediminibacterium paludis TaxID=908966 RepID=A0ABV8PVL7_9BACT